MKKKIYHVARVVAAVILLHTIYFKFAGVPGSVELFETLGMEPHGRIATGVIELIAGLLLLFGGRYIWVGAVLGICLMLGAVYYHAMILGLDAMFGMAVVTIIACVYVLWYTRSECDCLKAE